MCKVILSEKQKEIASFKEGAILVRASAGSGKTRVLVERIKMLAASTRRKVLAITFTNKACEEIKTRLAEVDESLLDHVFVSTFHGLCESIIESHIAATRFSVMPQIFTDDDRKKILEECISEIPSLSNWYRSLSEKERKNTLYKALDNISLIKRSLLQDQDLPKYIHDEQMRNIYFSFREYMDSLNAIDFDDLLFNAYLLLVNNPLIADLYRRGFTYICVDEAQDMNRAQYMVLRAITGSEYKNVMLVGDTKQSIYAFNGSSSDFMDKDFVRDYNPVVFDLKENYRSASSILNYAQKIVSDTTLNTVLPYTGLCVENAWETPCEEAKHVVDKIAELTGKEIEGFGSRLAYEDIAILGRNKFVLAKIEEQLKQNGIPYHYKTTGAGPEFSSVAARVFDLSMQVKSNPQDSLHFYRLQSLVELNGCKTLEDLYASKDILLSKIVKYANKLEPDCSNMNATINEIITFIKTLNVSSFLSEEEAIMAYDEFEMLKKHWLNYAKNTKNRSLPAFRNAMSLGQTASQKAENSVILSTIHTMKGQQAIVVFLVGMDDGTFPDYRAVKIGANSKEMQQERNNLYVAVTRAQRHLYISYPKKRMMPWGDWTVRTRSSLLPTIE